jgi:hypothetical protein
MYFTTHCDPEVSSPKGVYVRQIICTCQCQEAGVRWVEDLSALNYLKKLNGSSSCPRRSVVAALCNPRHMYNISPVPFSPVSFSPKI